MLFLKNLKDEFKQIKRFKFLLHEIANIGDIVEDDKCITCYVTQKLLDKHVKPVFYELYIGGMNTMDEQKRELIYYYQLDKKVHYVFDGIVFCSPIKIGSYCCEMTFRNCKFKYSPITILQADKITFENNQYKNGLANYKNQTFFRTVSHMTINELIFRNENFQNLYIPYNQRNYFGMDICAKKVKVVHSRIVSNHEQIVIKAKELEIVKSLLDAQEIYLDTDYVDATKSHLKAKKGLIVGNDINTCDVEIKLDDVFSPYVVFNGIEWVNYNNGNRTFYHDDPSELKEKRKEWIAILNHIKEKYASADEEEKIQQLQKRFKF